VSLANLDSGSRRRDVASRGCAQADRQNGLRGSRMKISHRIEPFEVSRDVQGNMADPTASTKGGLT
jgi:hypothetical protein